LNHLFRLEEQSATVMLRYAQTEDEKTPFAEVRSRSSKLAAHGQKGASTVVTSSEA
jgi:hypothetical protein